VKLSGYSELRLNMLESISAAPSVRAPTMCRNIKTLFNFDPPVTDEEVRAASPQFVRRITGLNKP